MRRERRLAATLASYPRAVPGWSQFRPHTLPRRLDKTSDVFAGLRGMDHLLDAERFRGGPRRFEPLDESRRFAPKRLGIRRPLDLPLEHGVDAALRRHPAPLRARPGQP